MTALDDACPTCGDRLGGHTMDAWVAHTKGVALDLPFEPIPEGPVPGTVATASIADHITVASALFEEPVLIGAVGAVEFRFEQGRLEHAPVSVADVTFVGTPDLLRKAGNLVRAACKQAATRVERQR